MTSGTQDNSMLLAGAAAPSTSARTVSRSKATKKPRPVRVAPARGQSWQQIGERGAYLVATDKLLCAISTDRDQIWKYDGTPDKWTKIGDRAKQLAAAGNKLYVISTDANTIWRYDGAPDKWTKIGDRAKQLVAVGSNLYVISTDRDQIWKYGGAPDKWTKIGDRAKQLAAAGKDLYVISTDRDQIWKYGGAPDQWTKIGDRAKQITAAGKNLYVISTDRDQIWRYDGAPDRWTKIGDRAKQIAAAGKNLYVISTDADAIWRYDGAPDKWSRFGDRAKQLAPSSKGLYVISTAADGIWAFGPSQQHCFTEGFSGTGVGPNLEDPDGVYAAADGVLRRTTDAGVGAGAGHRYVRTRLTSYRSTDWTYTIELDSRDAPWENMIIGLGSAARSNVAWVVDSPDASVYLTIDNRQPFGTPGPIAVSVQADGNNTSSETVGSYSGVGGKFSVKIEKRGNNATFFLAVVSAVGNYTVNPYTVDLAARAPWLTDANTRLFFGGRRTTLSWDNMEVCK